MEWGEKMRDEIEDIEVEGGKKKLKEILELIEKGEYRGIVVFSMLNEDDNRGSEDEHSVYFYIWNIDTIEVIAMLRDINGDVVGIHEKKIKEYNNRDRGFIMGS